MINPLKPSLNLRDALKIWYYIEPHMPEMGDKTNGELVGELFDNLPDDIYLSVVCELTDTDPSAIIDEDAVEAYLAFSEGLVANQIFSMQSFLRKIKP